MPSEKIVNSKSPRVVRCMTFSSCENDAGPSVALPMRSGSLKLLLPIILHHLKKVSTRRSPRDAVGLVRINHEPELLAGIDECVHHLDAVLKMDIIVIGSVHQQERSMQ